MVGTPATEVTCSSSISWAARVRVHLCIRTTLPPVRVNGSRKDCRPPTWNSRKGEQGGGGERRRGGRRCRGRRPSAWGRRRCAPCHGKLPKLRWVCTAPFGRPVVPRRVHDRGVVVGVDLHGGKGRIGAAHDVRPGHPTGDRHVRSDHRGGEEREAVEVRGEALGPLAVDHQGDRARVGEAEGQLGSGPPRVQGDDDRADRLRAPRSAIGHSGRLRVARRDPVALPHPDLGEPAGRRADLAMGLRERGALALVDEVVGVTVDGAELPHAAQRGRRGRTPSSGRRGCPRSRPRTDLPVSHGENLAVVRFPSPDLRPGGRRGGRGAPR